MNEAESEAVNERLEMRRLARLKFWHAQLDTISQELDKLKIDHESRDKEKILGPDISDDTHTRQKHVTYGDLLDSYYAALSLVTRLERGLTKKDEWLLYEPEDKLVVRLSRLQQRVAAYAGRDPLDLDRARRERLDQLSRDLWNEER